MGHAKKESIRASLHRSIDYSYSSSEAEAEADPKQIPEDPTRQGARVENSVRYFFPIGGKRCKMLGGVSNK